MRSVWSEITRPAKEKVPSQVRIMPLVRDQVWNQVGSQVHGRAWLVMRSVWHQVLDQVRARSEEGR